MQTGRRSLDIDCAQREDVRARSTEGNFQRAVGPLKVGRSLVDRTSPPATGITRWEDKNGYVLTQAEHLKDIYPSTSNITSWSRDVVYLRPSIFVVFDRTVTTGTVDPRMSWNFPPQPAPVNDPSPGAHRWDVDDVAVGFKGSITTLLPQNASVQTGKIYQGTYTNQQQQQVSVDKMYRVDVRPPSPAAGTMNWLTVLDASTSAGNVAVGQLPGNLSSTANGALLTTSGGNYVVLFGAGAVNQTISGTVSYVQPKVSTKLVVADLAPNTSYSVSATTNGSNYTVTIQQGSGFATTEYGTLYVVIAANGTVSAGT